MHIRLHDDRSIKPNHEFRVEEAKIFIESVGSIRRPISTKNFVVPGMRRFSSGGTREIRRKVRRTTNENFAWANRAKEGGGGCGDIMLW
jgi:hypothetical protein